MSRSFKKQPFQAVCGGGSAKRDKVMAHRGERRTHRLQIQTALSEGEFDIFLLPRRECRWNNVYCWRRDGNQRWCALTARDYSGYVRACSDPTDWRYGDHRFTVWPPAWFTEMMRK